MSDISHMSLSMLDFLRIFRAHSWSDPSDAFFLARITFPKDPSPKILTGWKLGKISFGWADVLLVSVWPEI
jgi:hypothetical protein